MNTVLAIKGHKTRDNEVIEILEMLGGENEEGLWGDNPNVAYYICDDNIIRCDWRINGYTLEEFLEKYPHKVGDKVTLDKWPCTITGMSWEYDDIIYYVQGSDFSKGVYSKDKDLQPYKEETVEERKYADLRLDVDQDDKLATEATIDGKKITPPENYLIGKVTTVDNGLLVEFVKKRPQLPKTYEECAKILECFSAYNIDGYKNELLVKLQELLICRDAYWKIAGEQMGLGRSWKPDWNDSVNIKWIIGGYKNKIVDDCNYYIHNILAFPTEEMRVAFNENFKELIEACRDFL
jgi:hypothetical protein